jgi:hypothetical protein
MVWVGIEICTLLAYSVLGYILSLNVDSYDNDMATAESLISYRRRRQDF